MSEIIKVIHNVKTGEVIERQMTAVEVEQYEKDLQDIAIKFEAEKSKMNAKIALLDRLGITAEEAKLLLS
jgi:hypothetical protein